MRGVWKTRTPANRPGWMTADARGHPTRLEAPLVTPVTLTCDTRGRVVSGAHGARLTTTTQGVTRGHQVSRTDALGRTTLSSATLMCALTR